MRNKSNLGTRSAAPRPSEAALIDSVEQRLREHFPPTWQVERFSQAANGRSRPDAAIVITAPDGEETTVAVEAKRHVDPKDVPTVAAQVRAYAETAPAVVVAPFLSPRARALLVDAHLGYADVTGNLRLELASPAAFILTTGSDRDIWRDARPLHSLKGPAAGRVVRALCEFRPPFGIRELAQHSNIPAPSISRVVTFLDQEALVTRGPRGSVEAVLWPQLIRRWTQDYALLTSNRVRTYLEPRGHAALLQTLRSTDVSYSLTGSLAAALHAPIAPSQLIVLYVEHATKAAERLGLRAVDTGTNVLLAEPLSKVVFERTTTTNGITYAALPQVAADLLTSPGRGPAEGEALLHWMEEHEDAWRH